MATTTFSPRRVFLLVGLFISNLAFLIIDNSVLAQGGKAFETSANIEYKIEDSGKTLVTNTISIKNVKSEVYPKKYVLSLRGIKPENLKAYEAGIPLTLSSQRVGDETKIEIIFENPVVGRGEIKTFVLTYEENSLAQKSGQIWEINVPRLNQPAAFDVYKVILSIPKLLGAEAYVSPEPVEIRKSQDRNLYVFEKEDLAKSGVTAGFGEFQIFSFTLNYQLENNLSSKEEGSIAIPPDTSTQRMYYESITPVPKNVQADSDGNWLAVFDIPPKTKVDVKVSGAVQIFSSPRKFLNPESMSLSFNTQSSVFWQVDDPEIRKLADELNTPKAIYDFVTQNLRYNNERVKPNPLRLGAKSALNDPANALCMEFTDLFVALSRAAGIPAREINGYAYSQNKVLEPLSLVADVLHSWPEYWNDVDSVWVPVDPTWGATTQGVDFFSKFDLRHFAFVIHGKDPTSPNAPGSYKLEADPKKDVFVSFGKLPDKKLSDVQISYQKKGALSLFSKKVVLEITNNGSTASYDFKPEIILKDTVKSENISVFPPYSKYKQEVTIAYGLFAVKAPEALTVYAGKNKLDIPINKGEVIVNQLILICIILITCLNFLYYKITKRKIINLKSFYLKVASLYADTVQKIRSRSTKS